MAIKDENLIENVSDTALWVAVFRALETERPDALFKDPYAKELAGERGKQIAAQMKSSRYVSWSVVIRTVIIDNYIQKKIEDGIDTIVNLGAGLDTRPYRLSLPETLRWVEVDYPHMIASKERILESKAPNCRLERVAMDLSLKSERRNLFEKLNEESKDALILTEGVIPYLTNEQVAILAKDLRRQPHFHSWITDYFSPQALHYMRRSKRMQNAPFQFAPHNWFDFFDEHGWSPESVRYVPEESVHLGRPIPEPWIMPLIRLFLSKKTKALFPKMTAYVLWERKAQNLF